MICLEIDKLGLNVLQLQIFITLPSFNFIIKVIQSNTYKSIEYFIHTNKMIFLQKILLKILLKFTEDFIPTTKLEKLPPAVRETHAFQHNRGPPLNPSKPQWHDVRGVSG